jgi:membrane protein DedA with SNARE-associated domain
MLHWIAHAVLSLSYYGVALLMAVENVILPLPSELIMPFAGANTGPGKMTLWGVIVAGSIGGALGALPLYYLAWIFGAERVTHWVERHGRWFLLRRGDLQKARDRFDRKGISAVFLSQLLPGIRGLISLPAGFARMNVFLYLAVNFAGTLVWCAVLAILGRVLGDHYEEIHKFLGPTGWIVLGIVVVGGVAWLFVRKSGKPWKSGKP